eukprot:30854-Pelagococcus_subviridis.AAC.5
MFACESNATLSSALMKSLTGLLRTCSMNMNTIVLYTTGEYAFPLLMNACRSWNMHASAWICVAGCGSRAVFFNTATAFLQSSPMTSISSGNADQSVVSNVRALSRSSTGPSAQRSASRRIAPGVSAPAIAFRGPAPRASNAGINTFNASTNRRGFVRASAPFRKSSRRK